MEIWDLYDKNKNLTGQTHIRGNVIPEGCYHLVVHVVIRNSKGEYLIAQRDAERQSYPLLYEFVGGSILAGETSLEGAVREVQEELGVILVPQKGKLIYSEVRDAFNGKKFSDIMDVWYFEYNGDFDLEKATTKEVLTAGWATIEKIRQRFEDGSFVPTLGFIFDVDKKLKEKDKKNRLNKNKKKAGQSKDKSRYFDYYDDVKHNSHRDIAW